MRFRSKYRNLRTLNRYNSERSFPQHIRVKLPNQRQRIIKPAIKEVVDTYKGTTCRLIDFSAETLQARMMGLYMQSAERKKQNLPARNTVFSKVIFVRNEGEITCFP